MLTTKPTLKLRLLTWLCSAELWWRGRAIQNAERRLDRLSIRLFKRLRVWETRGVLLVYLVSDESANDSQPVSSPEAKRKKSLH